MKIDIDIEIFSSLPLKSFFGQTPIPKSYLDTDLEELLPIGSNMDFYYTEKKIEPFTITLDTLDFVVSSEFFRPAKWLIKIKLI